MIKNEWWLGPLAGMMIACSIFTVVILMPPVVIYYIAPLIIRWYSYWGF